MLHKQKKIKTEAVSFRIDVQLLETIRAECYKADVSLSDGIRQILQAFSDGLKKNEKGSIV